MDSKRDIRPKLASRLLKDSLVLHCLFRVSLATQHIIGTIIFLKQRKTRIRITSSLNLRALGRYVVRMYERARVRSPCAPSPSLLTARPVAVTSGSPARDATGRSFRPDQIIQRDRRTRRSNNADRTNEHEKELEEIRKLRIQIRSTGEKYVYARARR